jgi:glycosyltransferase involved in cell wall biosynthesis
LYGYIPIYSVNDYQKIVTIYHIAPKNFLDPLSQLMDAYLDENYIRRLTASDTIIATSQYTKETLIKFFRIREEKIKVIYIGAALQPLPHKISKPSIKPPYVLYVGSFEERKNVPSVVKAFYKFKKAYTDYIHLHCKNIYILTQLFGQCV